MKPFEKYLFWELNLQMNYRVGSTQKPTEAKEVMNYNGVKQAELVSFEEGSFPY